jgi:hypothetical protein
MRVIGAGFSRTGTTSLQAALERLGYGPCLHGWDFAGHPALIRDWLAAYRNPQQTDWEALLGSYDVTLEFPMAALWRELAEAFPEAKIIVSVRDENAWYDSMAGSVFRIPLWLHPTARRILRRVAIRTSSWLPPYPGMYEEVVYEGVFGGRLDRAGAIAVYQQHTEDVVEHLPPDRVLVWRAAEGWEPLCAFLGVPVPNEPFPRLNDLSSWQDVIRQWPVHMVRQVRASARGAWSRARGRHPESAAVVPPARDGACPEASDDARELLVTDR